MLTAFFVTADLQNAKNMGLGVTQTYATFVRGKASDLGHQLAGVGHSTWLWVLVLVLPFTGFMTSQKSLLSEPQSFHLETQGRTPISQNCFHDN